MSFRIDPGSFRDPAGRIVLSRDSVLRTVMPAGAEAYRAAAGTGIYDALAERGLMLPVREVEGSVLTRFVEGAAHVLEATRIPFISYPYEWSFSLHKRAALLHLDLHLAALECGFTLSDASAYNVQFLGTKPVFIDHLSLRPYRDGEIWTGHRQFCMQFLDPLICHALLGVRPNAWFRGSLEGIAPEEFAPLLKARHKLSWTVLSHVVMQAALQRRLVRDDRPKTARLKRSRLPRSALIGMLKGLRSYIARLDLRQGRTVWSDYAEANGYAEAEAVIKRRFVHDMVAATRPAVLWDLGCNSGEFSDAALDAGAGYVVGFDYDTGALERAFARSDARGAPFLPLWMDAANPSPAQGWAQQERAGIGERASAQALIALAFLHHIAIGRNVPLGQAVEWLIGLAPTGVIEFVPKSDPMMQRLLALREDIFADYTEVALRAHVEARARIRRAEHLSESGRLLVWYDRS